MMFSFHAGHSPPQNQGTREPRPKRAKIRIACNVCKGRKTKCDGARPICGPCSRRRRTLSSTGCIYREDDGRENSGYTSERPNDDDGASFYSAYAPASGLFGASSGAHIPQDIGKESGLPSTLTNQTQPALPRALKRLPKVQKQNSRKDPAGLQFVIPPRKQADHYMSLYWDYVDNAYPWLDRPSIERAYEALWVKDGEPAMNETVLHCLLNLMFATSCVAYQSGPAHARYQSSVVFFDRAQVLMSFELMSLFNFEIIQILLLTAVYLLHDKEPQKCFRIIGTAIHIAQELGLHIPDTTKAMDSGKERDLARQVWNGCVVMDRICAMTFGCRLKVSRSAAEQGLNSLVLGSVESSSGTGASSLPSKVNFYISFCRLHHIIAEVLETFYIFDKSKTENKFQNANDQGRTSSLPFDKFASLFHIDFALKEWACSLHPFFQKPSELQDPTPTKHITREANILRARYLSVRLLLFRLLLLQMHQERTENIQGNGLYSNDEQVMPHVVFQCQVNCTKAATDMIQFILRNSPEQKQAYILPSNWYTVSYVYMAVTNLLAAQSSPQIVEYFSADRLHGALEQARGILKDYEKHAPLASRCSSVLKLIEQNIGRLGSVAGLASSEASQVARGHDNTAVGDYVLTHEPQATLADDAAMMDTFTFDWNEWPMFFAQLDGDTTSAESWGGVNLVQ